MIIEHITSIECAYEIVKSGKYRPVSTDPLHGDAGLNCLNGSGNNHYENVGVVLKFNWLGPTQATEKQYDLPKNVLIDNGPWRLIVPTKTYKHLTFDSLEINDDEAFVLFVTYLTPWHFKYPFSNWLEKEKSKYISFFKKTKGISISLL